LNTLIRSLGNAGGFGTLGGARYTPQMLREMIAELKEALVDKKSPFGVDLLLPKVGEGARATNVSLLSIVQIKNQRGCPIEMKERTRGMGR
jgi:hypothetical protein